MGNFKYLFLVFCSFFFAHSSLAVATLNVENTATSSNSTFSGYQEQGTTFNIGDHCSFSSISLLYGANITSASLLRLYEGYNGRILGEQAISSRLCSVNTYCNFAFTSPISGLKKNETYYVGIENRSGTAMNTYYSLNTYADGQMYYADNVLYTGKDLTFKIYYEPDVDVICYEETAGDTASTTSETMENNLNYIVIILIGLFLLSFIDFVRRLFSKYVR